MALLVAVLVVLALAAILRRFVFRDASGAVRLPRVIDDSLGMWVLRRLAGRPTDGYDDPFERFRRPSTVIGRRPDALRAPVRDDPPAPPQPEAPLVLADSAGTDAPPWMPPAWSSVERTAAGGRAFGTSIEPVTEVPVRSRLRVAAQYAVLVVAVAIGGLAVGALAGAATGPNPSTAAPTPAASTAADGAPGRSGANPSTR